VICISIPSTIGWFLLLMIELLKSGKNRNNQLFF